MNKSNQILFKKDNDGFTKELNSTVKLNLSKGELKRAVFLLWIKLFFYLLFFFVSIYVLYLNPYSDNFLYLLLNYTLIGTSGVLLAFNSWICEVTFCICLHLFIICNYYIHRISENSKNKIFFFFIIRTFKKIMIQRMFSQPRNCIKIFM